jgi:hypothetical protein
MEGRLSREALVDHLRIEALDVKWTEPPESKMAYGRRDV